MGERTIFIRQRQAGFGVVVKPFAPGQNNLGPLSHEEAAIYAEKLSSRLGFQVVDESER